MLELLEGGERRGRDEDGDVAALKKPDDGEGEEHLVCVACGHRITSARARVEVAGHHRHVCANPSGIPYDIGCFSLAPGCASRGPFESYWTWFSGYDWQIAVCGGCNAHVGWAFRNTEGGGFHGLILGRIVEATDDA